jgi:catechol 2,3-dioxygenase-like lactoylglutathione lyase family enzyme
MPRLDHVNLCVPPSIGEQDGAAAEGAWLCDVLGYEPVQAGPDATRFGTLYWFAADDGTQVHLTIDPEHQPSARAHTAIRIGDALDTTVARLESAGHSCNALEFDGDRHVFTNDPAGNLWELIGPPASA